MNSKGIEPRVGMQYTWMGQSKKIHAIRGKAIDCMMNGEIVTNSSDVETWDMHPREITWIPPTDEERERFRNYANSYRSDIGIELPWYGGTVHDFCHEQGWNEKNTGKWDIVHMKEIAESLSMDGM